MAPSLPPPLEIDPPLLNSACPWATDLEDLKRLYACPHTGAVTTRTSLIRGFPHDDSVHQYALFDAATHKVAASSSSSRPRPSGTGTANASLNTLGYSPHVLQTYLSFIRAIATDPDVPRAPGKTFIVSVTGSAEEVARCYRLVAEEVRRGPGPPLAVELNLSCPNIPGSPPPAYDAAALRSYLAAVVAAAAGEATSPPLPRIPFGLKTPPYTHPAQYDALVGALLDCAGGAGGVCPVSFLTATNTLGSSLVLAGGDAPAPALPGRGVGGLAGAPLHPLALGNVATLRRMLDEHPRELGHVRVIGVGGVLDAGGCARMRAAGAYAVAVATGLGAKGVGVFEEIAQGSGGGGGGGLARGSGNREGAGGGGRGGQRRQQQKSLL